MLEIQRKVHHQLHVKFCQIFPNELGRPNPPDTCIHFNGGMGQILWRSFKKRITYLNFNAIQICTYLLKAEAKDAVVNVTLFFTWHLVLHCLSFYGSCNIFYTK